MPLLIDNLTLAQIRRVAGDDAIRVLNSHADSISDLISAYVGLAQRVERLEASLKLDAPAPEAES